MASNFSSSRGLSNRFLSRLLNDSSDEDRDHPRSLRTSNHPIHDLLARPKDPAVTLRRLGHLAADHGANRWEDRRSIEALCDELIAGKTTDDLFLNLDERFLSFPVAERLLDQSRVRWSLSPDDALAIAELACSISDDLEPVSFTPGLLADLRARSRAYLGECFRRMADYHACDEAFLDAQTHLAQGTGDPLLEAEILCLEAHRIDDDGDCSAALDRLDRAIDTYRDLDERPLLAGALAQKGVVVALAGGPRGAVEELESAVEALGPTPELPTLAEIYLQLAYFWNECKDHTAAERYLELAAGIETDVADPAFGERLRWTAGRIDMGQDRVPDAERNLLSAQQGFVRRGMTDDAALVTLDLADLYARVGRFDDVRRLAGEMVPMLNRRHLHSQILAALAAFRRAADDEMLSTDLLRELAECLGRSGDDLTTASAVVN